MYEATPRDPLVLGGVVVAMALLGLLATRMPAQRALSIDPIDIASRGVNVNCPVQNQIGSQTAKMKPRVYNYVLLSCRELSWDASARLISDSAEVLMRRVVGFLNRSACHNRWS